MTGHAPLVVCMGVSGCGKTTVAHAIAQASGLRFLEADDFHSEADKARMASGKPLDDAMRRPWIESICAALERERTAGSGCVLACSALRRDHRNRFRQTGFRTLFLFLHGSREQIAAWMTERQGHYMPVELLDSQFEALESPRDEPDVIAIDLENGWEECTRTAVQEALDFVCNV